LIAALNTVWPQGYNVARGIGSTGVQYTRAERRRRSVLMRARWAAMSPAERAAHAERAGAGMRARWARLAPTERSALARRARAGLRKDLCPDVAGGAFGARPQGVAASGPRPAPARSVLTGGGRVRSV
jgi:hypothetical protein